MPSSHQQYDSSIKSDWSLRQKRLDKATQEQGYLLADEPETVVSQDRCGPGVIDVDNPALGD